ncbi:curlin subunit CsgB [Glaciecola sp. 1036]|uniref:curlin subunit CsgB n=1 Tax=Alteromonadaceae TaxID=72275 RepID=UPI003D028B85
MQYINSGTNTKFFRIKGMFAFVVLCCLHNNNLYAQTSDLKSTDDLVESPLSLSLSPQVIVYGESQSIINIGQFGLNNTTNIIQTGNASNLSNVIQAGSNNTADITQLGAGNIVNLLQENNNNSFEIIQDGFDNVANVNQLGEQSFIVQQIGNEMVINITQYQE